MNSIERQAARSVPKHEMFFSDTDILWTLWTVLPQPLQEMWQNLFLALETFFLIFLDCIGY